MIFHTIYQLITWLFSGFNTDERRKLLLIVQNGIPLLGVVVVWKQLGSAKRVARAELIRQIGGTAQLEEYSNIIKAIEDNSDINQIAVREFLRFFESVTLMLENGLISCNEIFPLTGYRMLLVLNSKEVRDNLLCKDKSSAVKFCAVFVLHKKLTRHFKKHFNKDEEAKKLYYISEDDLSSYSEYEILVNRYHKSTRNWWNYFWFRIACHFEVFFSLLWRWVAVMCDGALRLLKFILESLKHLPRQLFASMLSSWKGSRSCVIRFFKHFKHNNQKGKNEQKQRDSDKGS